MVAYSSAMMVWQAKSNMDPLGARLFPQKTIDPNEKVVTRSHYRCEAKLPAPGYGTLAANLLSRAWNASAELQNASTLGAAKAAARKWSKSLVKY